MTIPGWNDPAEDDRNPHRVDERRAVRDELEARLRERNVPLSGDESDEQVVALLDAVEEFESRRARLGADTYTNQLMSSQPDDPRLVLPPRQADESVDAYAQRIRQAGAGL